MPAAFLPPAPSSLRASSFRASLAPSRPPHRSASQPQPCRRVPPPTMQAPDPTPAVAPSPPAAPPPPLSLQFLDNNSFALSTPTTTLLLDPWLHSDLVFLTPPFFQSSKSPAGLRAASAVHLPSLSALVLTQSLPDHAHPPSLELLPRTLPVYCPRSAVPLLKSLAFSTIHPMQPSQSLPVSADLTITAVTGSLVGPPWSEPQLGFVFQAHPPSAAPVTPVSVATSLYHEPHGNHEFADLKPWHSNLDAVIVPVVSTKIPALNNYALVNGVPQAIQLCHTVRPKRCITFDNSGGEQKGFLPRFLKKDGNLETFQARVAASPQLRDMQVLSARTGETIVIEGSR